MGNHEFDQGYDDLVNRVMAPYNADDQPVRRRELGVPRRQREVQGDPATRRSPPTWIKTMNGVKVGFVGAVTEHLPELVSPGGIADIEVTDIVDAANAEADELKADGADIVVLLVHEGAGGTDCATIGRRPDVRLRQDHHRRRRERRRDRVRPHPPRVQLPFPVPDWGTRVAR